MLNLEVIEKFRNDEDLVKIYGFILFTRSNSNILKVLNDDDYWAGFNEDSKGWLIFSIRTAQGKLEFPSFPKDMIGFMVPIWKEPSENLTMLDYFELNSSEKYLPSMVLFAPLNDGKIKKVVYPLNDDSLDSARNSIKNIISLVTNTINNILPEYKNSDSVFREVCANAESKLFWEDVKKTTKLFSFLNSLKP